jgi:hypothetical protein
MQSSPFRNSRMCSRPRIRYVPATLRGISILVILPAKKIGIANFGSGCADTDFRDPSYTRECAMQSILIIEQMVAVITALRRIRFDNCASGADQLMQASNSSLRNNYALRNASSV